MQTEELHEAFKGSVLADIYYSQQKMCAWRDSCSKYASGTERNLSKLSETFDRIDSLAGSMNLATAEFIPYEELA